MTKTYEVTISRKIAAYGYGGMDRGSIVEVSAKNKKDAISQARKINERQGFYDRHDGPLNYRAEEVGA